MFSSEATVYKTKLALNKIRNLPFQMQTFIYQLSILTLNLTINVIQGRLLTNKSKPLLEIYRLY